MLIGFHWVNLLLWCWLLFSCSPSDFDDIDFYNNWAAKIRVLLWTAMQDKNLYPSCVIYEGICSNSLVKLHIFEIKKSLTHERKKHMEENTHKCPLFLINFLKVDYISSTYKVKPHVTKKNMSKKALYKHHYCVRMYCSQKQFLYSG